MIVIIKACGNNIASIKFALARLQQNCVVTNDPDTIRRASHVILPGVGHANKTMERLDQLDLIPLIQQLQQPVLGICLGMQLLYESTEEGDCKGLGIIPGNVVRLSATEQCLIPHMGWNRVSFLDGPVDCNNQYAYFVHSFMAPINRHTVATTQHSKRFASMVKRNNFTGMQFHPERSGKFGERLLQQFLGVSTC